MRPKKVSKKLSLNKATVAHLSDGAMQDLLGGTNETANVYCVSIMGFTCYYTCVCGGTGSDPCFDPSNFC